MKKLTVLALAGMALCLAGCLVPSVNPLYTEADLVFEPGILGEWGEPDAADRWIFAKEGDKAYLWTVWEKESTNVFRAHLTQLGEHQFLDAILVRTHSKWEGLGRAAVVIRPAHIFFKVRFTGTTLRLDGLDPEWLERLVEKEPNAVRHERVWEPDYEDEHGRVLLTASTPELRRFMLEHAGNEKAFAREEPLPRLQAATGKPTEP